MFYVDVQNGSEYTLYYNMTTAVNENVVEATQGIIHNRIILPSAYNYVNKVYGGKFKEGRADDNLSSNFKVMGSYNPTTGFIDYQLAKEMAGITAMVSEGLAEKVLERAVYYCPKDTGWLASTGRIEDLGDGSCRIYFDCDYAWYVHEFTWVDHEFPTCAKFLTLAIQEVQTMWGRGVI